MFKYKVISQYNNQLTWDVRISMKFHPTVGDFIREIKSSKLENKTIKEIYIYRKGIVVGKATFAGDLNTEWSGSPKDLWEAEVDRCEMTTNGYNIYTYEIYIKEPREGYAVKIHPIVPWLIDMIKKPIPTGLRG